MKKIPLSKVTNKKLNKSIANIISDELYRFMYPDAQLSKTSISLEYDGLHRKIKVLENMEQKKDVTKDKIDLIDSDMFIRIYEHTNVALMYLNNALKIPLIYEEITSEVTCMAGFYKNEKEYEARLPFFCTTECIFSSSQAKVAIDNSKNNNLFSNMITFSPNVSLNTITFVIKNISAMYSFLSSIIKEHIMILLGQSKETINKIYENYIGKEFIFGI